MWKSGQKTSLIVLKVGRPASGLIKKKHVIFLAKEVLYPAAVLFQIQMAIILSVTKLVETRKCHQKKDEEKRMKLKETVYFFKVVVGLAVADQTTTRKKRR